MREVLFRAIVRHWARWCTISIGFVILYYAGVLLLVMWRFGEIPNYVEFHHLFKNYELILDGTPALSDAIPIMLDESWFEAGFKDPDYYGVASWSYMLIPPKILLVFFTGTLLATVAVLAARGKAAACRLLPSRQYAAAGAGSALVGLANVTLTWVVCCATPSWVVAFAMLGMSVPLATSLTPYGSLLTLSGLGLLAGVIARQARVLVRTGGGDRPAVSADGEVQFNHAHA